MAALFLIFVANAGQAARTGPFFFECHIGPQ
jgi:hypothetical protein